MKAIVVLSFFVIAMRDACPSDPGIIGTYTNCTSTCHDDEFAISCGGVSSPTSIPSSCRFVGASPGGATTGCCPCGS